MAKGTFKQNTAELFISAADPGQKKTRKPTQARKPTTKKTTTPAQDFQVPKGYRLEKELKSERLQLLVRPTTKEEIKKAAKAQGISVNDLINNLLDDYVERQGNV